MANSIYFSSHIYVANSPIAEKGIFTSEPIKAGTVIFQYYDITKHNTILTSDNVKKLPGDQKAIFLKYGYQIDDDLFAGPIQLVESFDISIYLNHNCSPNTYFLNENTIVALRDIAIGEELTFDYATTDSYEWQVYESDLYSAHCNCGSAECRGQILPTDWMLPELQKKYDGYFMPYLAKKIAQQHTHKNKCQII